MTDPFRFILAGVRMTTNQLSDLELAALGNVAFTGMNPTGIMCYDKVASLFTEQNGTKMHAEALRALSIIVDERPGKGKTES